MEIEVKEAIHLDDGKHIGKITRVEYREEPYRYTDIYIEEDKTKLELKFGCPTSKSINSKLMKLLAKFVEIKSGITVNPESILVDKGVEFMTLVEQTEKGNFTRIVDGSVKPRVKEEKVI